MRAKNRAPGHVNDDSNKEGRKKPKVKGYHEALAAMRNEIVAAEMAKRRAVLDAEKREAEEEVARMTYGPAYKSAD